MLNTLLLGTGVIYAVVVGCLFLFGLNFFYLTYLALKPQKGTTEATPLLPLRRVTVQLPIYNELYVASRLVVAATRLDYPKELLEIQVLDDSTDETAAILREQVRGLRSQGVNIHYLHRADRAGYKAGALAAGLEVAQGEFLAVFDSDFIPPPDFLMRTLPLFADPKIAFVQARWGHINSGYSLLTLLQSLAIDAHFIVEQAARSGNGYWFNFNGTAGIWRKAAIQDAGGWRADTLTEDLDLSYRCFLRGWRAGYLRDLQVPGELPASFNAFRRQQQRWARGSFECAGRLLPQIWKAHLPLPIKLESTLHLTGYGVHLLLFALALLYPFVLLLTLHIPSVGHLIGLGYLFNATALAPAIFFTAAQKLAGRKWVRLIPAILFMTVMGCGMMVNSLYAALNVITRQPARFERTPKYGIQGRADDWRRRPKYQLRTDRIIFSEIALAAWNGVTCGLAASHHSWGIALYSAIFAAGLLYVSLVSLAQAHAVHQRRAVSALEGGS